VTDGGGLARGDAAALGEALDGARRVADAVLYEGYLLFPYRGSAQKNRYRWQWGVVAPAALDIPDLDKLSLTGAAHPPRILILYGSLRPQSYSRKLALEAERLLQRLGAETRVFDPHRLPLVGEADAGHPKVRELRALSLWSEGQVWVSPERHGTLTAVFKNQIDWLPLEDGGVRPTQGRTLAVMQVCGGSQSFNVVNALRVLGRWMRMLTIPNQSSVPKAWQEFDDDGRMRPSPYYDRVVDVVEELIKFTLLVRDRSPYLTSRYSERKADPHARALASASGAMETPARAIKTEAKNPAATTATADVRPTQPCCTGTC
jgi:arsenical resistance protein ArsH